MVSATKISLCVGECVFNFFFSLNTSSKDFLHCYEQQQLDLSQSWFHFDILKLRRRLADFNLSPIDLATERELFTGETFTR